VLRLVKKDKGKGIIAQSYYLLIRQLLLIERDLNIGKMLNFILILKRGRIRYTTLKGRENFYIDISNWSRSL